MSGSWNEDPVGRDLSVRFCLKKKSKKAIPLKNYSNISFVCDDFINYNFVETFDIIYSSLTMMHFENKEQVILKVESLLKDGGIFCVSIDKNQNDYIDKNTPIYE